MEKFTEVLNTDQLKCHPRVEFKSFNFGFPWRKNIKGKRFKSAHTMSFETIGIPKRIIATQRPREIETEQKSKSPYAMAHT